MKSEPMERKQRNVIPEEFVRDLIHRDEECRKSVAKELHGSIQSKLSACLLLLSGYEQMVKEQGKQNAPIDVIDRVRGVMEGLLRCDIDRMISDLYPPLLSIGLLPALKLLFGKEAAFCEDELSFRVDLHIEEEFRVWDFNVGESSIETLRLELYRFIESIKKRRGVKSIHFEINGEETHVTITVNINNAEWTDSVDKDISSEWFAKRLCIMGGEVRFNHSLGNGMSILTVVMPVSNFNQE